MAGQLRNVQIMKVGSWTGSAGQVEFTIGDLEDMVRSFYELSQQSGFQPHIKLGHEEAQRFFGQREGFPSLGYVERIWRDGDIVCADFGNVPEPVLDMVAQRRYSQVSVEMYPEYDFEGRKFRNVLAAVALLGAELPAVKGLRELADSLYKDGTTKFTQNGKVEFTQMSKTQAEIDAETKAAADAAAAAAAAVTNEADKAAFAAVQTRLATVEAALEAERKANAALAVAAATDKFSAKVEAAIKEGRLLPKQKDTVLQFGAALIGVTNVKVKFSAGDKTSEETLIDGFTAFLEGLSKSVDFKEHGAAKGIAAANPSDGDAPAAQVLDEHAQTLVKEKKIDYAEALRTVIAEATPELRQRYADGQ